MKMKIFMVDEWEYWAGKSAADVKKAYLDLIGEKDAEEYADIQILKLSQKKMKEYIFNDDDGSKRTFEEELQRMIESGEKFPCIFAVTEG